MPDGPNRSRGQASLAIQKRLAIRQPEGSKVPLMHRPAASTRGFGTSDGSIGSTGFSVPGQSRGRYYTATCRSIRWREARPDLMCLALTRTISPRPTRQRLMHVLAAVPPEAIRGRLLVVSLFFGRR